jgi:RNA polymerase sigma-70 factor (sigma-E family)
VRKSDEAEYTELIAARAHALRRTAYLFCGDWHQAEDLVQTVFISLYTAWPRIQRKDNLDGYLRKSLIHACIDASRSRQRREAPFAELPETAVVLNGPGLEEREALIAALAEIGPRQRAVLVLRYWEDLSVEETAGILGVSTGTVKSQASRGLVALRAALARPAHADD